MYTVRPARHTESECFLRVSGQQFSVVCLNIVKSALEMQASAFGGLTQRLQGAPGPHLSMFHFRRSEGF